MKNFSLLLSLSAISIFAIGCTDPAQTPTAPTDVHSHDDGHDHADHDGHDHDDHAGHDHDSHEGHDHAAADHTPPHGGHLIELGRNHEYHAELVDDHDNESVTVYIMDGDMQPLSINQSAVKLTMTAGDKSETFELMANQPGSASEFTSLDENLMEMIEADEAQGKLRVTINDKPYSGAFDHHAHGHDH